MRFDSLGNLGAGVGTNIVSINQFAMATGGGTRPLGNGWFLAQAQVLPDPEQRIYAFKTGFTPRLFSLEGANNLGAGNDNWAGSLLPSGKPILTFGVYRNGALPEFVSHLPILDVGLDGQMVFFGADYTTLVILWPDGGSEALPVGAHCLG